jgi:hypothetical protein
MDRIEWAIAGCRLLQSIGDELERTRPFDALTATGAVGPDACVVPVPRAIDETVASAFVALA